MNNCLLSGLMSHNEEVNFHIRDATSSAAGAPDSPNTPVSPVTEPINFVGSPPVEPQQSYSPFIELDRATWSRLAHELEQPFDQSDVERLRGLGDQLSLTEVAEVYLPLSRLLSIYVEASAKLREASNKFLGDHAPHPICHWCCRFGGSRQVDDCPRVAGNVASLAQHPTGGVGDHRWFPLSQC